MVGFEIKDLAIIRPAVDIFSPEAIRASMGSLFKIRFQYFNSFEQYRNSNKTNVVYLLMTDGEKLICDLKFKTPWSCIFGSESAGLPEGYKKLGQSVRITQSSDIDSFNLAISVGITLFAVKSC